jgi:putative tryptophan/tyrosine transport system substrate-binding protein
MSDMRRRGFITIIGGAAVAWPLAARAQQSERMRRVGVLIVFPENDPSSQRRVTAFQQELAKLGWTVGRNLQIDYRWAISDDERAKAATAELLALAPDLILANATTAVAAAQQATGTVPIVFAGVSEPVAQGFVASLTDPGGNITGFTNLEPSVSAKWLELLKEIAPGVTRVGIMFKPALSHAIPLFQDLLRRAAPKFTVELIESPVHDSSDIEAVLTALGREPGGGLILLPDTFLASNLKLILEMTARHRVPAIYPFRYFVSAGGLVSYGPDVDDQFRQAAAYVDRILRGEKPGNLPVQQPTKFEMVINMKTAKALGLTVPDKLLVAADEVIE